jgi:PhzF family phenazine biosynthesis protein
MAKTDSKPRRGSAGGGARKNAGGKTDRASAAAQPVQVVDAFVTGLFTGNPAAVCVLERPAKPEWMRLVAREMNLSETAFLYPIKGGYHLRWFTPAVEVDLCGHATLASSHVLWETGRLRPDETARFKTLSGWLSASRAGDEIELNFPARVPRPTKAPAGLAKALGARPRFVGLARDDLFVELESDEAVRRLAPDFGALKRLGPRGAIVTARSDDKAYDFVSRFFAPGAGIDEDPVTGAAHCALSPYWTEKLGRTELVGYQASARGGRVRVRLEGDRVRLAGRAVTMLRGELLH